jgi:protein KTI12
MEQNYLYELDKQTSDIINQITSWQKDHPGEDGGEVPIAGVEAAVELPVTPLKIPQMQRIRRQFIALNRQHNLDKERIGLLFVDYLNASFRG